MASIASIPDAMEATVPLPHSPAHPRIADFLCRVGGEFTKACDRLFYSVPFITFLSAVVAAVWVVKVWLGFAS